MKWVFAVFLLMAVFLPVWGETLYSPTWGFRIDLPEGYVYADGDGRARFSFAGPAGVRFDLAVYGGVYRNLRDLVDDVNLRLKNQGECSFFEYNGRLAALIELRFDAFTGWGLCVELDKKGNDVPLLLALSYGSAEAEGLDVYHLCAIDSVAPSKAEMRYPGPLTEFGYPRGNMEKTEISGAEIAAWFRENDAEAAQSLVDREFALLRNYLFQDNWQEAWARFYRAIYRDSWDRLADAVFQLERKWDAPDEGLSRQEADYNLAQNALSWVQGFQYERNLQGSDFVNLVTAAIEGRGDCDSRALLWAILLAQADIPAAIMVSREHSHAMGLADISGEGARFEAGGKKWLVAETTAQVDIGLIAQDVSGIEAWLGIMFE